MPIRWHRKGRAERSGPCFFVRLFFPPSCSNQLQCCLYAEWASLVFDYVVRQKISHVHLKFNIVKQLPTIPPTFYTAPRLDFIVPRVLELTYTSHSLTPFARDLGYDGPPFGWDEDRRALLRAELDAFYARAYGLDRDELRYILDPADVRGPDYPSETFRVLKEKEIRKYGEYRTRRIVLDAWDRMEAERSSPRWGYEKLAFPRRIPSAPHHPSPLRNFKPAHHASLEIHPHRTLPPVGKPTTGRPRHRESAGGKEQ